MTASTTELNETRAGGARHLTPAEIDMMVKSFRTAQGWTQETLAELSGLQTRTIQRVEQGQPSSTDTRRAIVGPGTKASFTYARWAGSNETPRFVA